MKSEDEVLKIKKFTNQTSLTHTFDVVSVLHRPIFLTDAFTINSIHEIFIQMVPLDVSLVKYKFYDEGM